MIHKTWKFFSVVPVSLNDSSASVTKMLLSFFLSDLAATTFHDRTELVGVQFKLSAGV